MNDDLAKAKDLIAQAIKLTSANIPAASDSEIAACILDAACGLNNAERAIDRIKHVIASRTTTLAA